MELGKEMVAEPARKMTCCSASIKLGAAEEGRNEGEPTY